MKLPPALRPGDRIAAVAPSGPFDRTLVLRGLGFLAQRYRVAVDWRLFRADGFLAGTDQERQSELNQALAEPSVRAVFNARGGYGLTRILDGVTVGSLASDPKWLVGFSDFTALHLLGQRHGLITVHGPNLTGLGRGDERARQDLLGLLEHPTRPRTLTGTWGLRGTARGPLWGGNLTLVFTQAAAGQLQLPAGVLLLLEDVGETSYRIDRMLTALMSAGALDGVRGLVLGEFLGCGSGRFQVSTQAVLHERLGQLGVPVVAGLPIGHGRNNEPVLLGASASIDGAARTLTLGVQDGWPPAR